MRSTTTTKAAGPCPTRRTDVWHAPVSCPIYSKTFTPALWTVCYSEHTDSKENINIFEGTQPEPSLFLLPEEFAVYWQYTHVTVCIFSGCYFHMNAAQCSCFWSRGSRDPLANLLKGEIKSLWITVGDDRNINGYCCNVRWNREA